MTEVFPARRPNGTTSVGARFDVPGRDGRAFLEMHVSDWRDPVDGLAEHPVIEDVAGSVVEVVFEGKANSRLWKDAMVAFVSGVPNDVGSFVGFYDRVRQRMHPASVPRE